MTGNFRPRQAFHNTFGDNVSEKDGNDPFQNQGNDPFSSNLSQPGHLSQRQPSLQYSSGQSTSSVPGMNPNTSENTFGSKSGRGNRTFAPASNLVSSPFSQRQSVQSNPTSSPFGNTASVTNPNLAGNYPFPATSSPPTHYYGQPQPQSQGQGQGPGQATAFPGQQTNLGAPSTTGFTGFSNPNLTSPGMTNFGSFQTPGFVNPQTQAFQTAQAPTFASSAPQNPMNQSQMPTDRSNMYLDGQLGQIEFVNRSTQSFQTQHQTTPGYVQNNAVFPNPLNQNPLNLSSLSRSANFSTQMTQMPQQNILPGQLGAQLTKFGQIYNQRLQMTESETEVDPPLLDELGINVVEIYNHMVSVIFPKKGNQTFLNYEDLYGPLMTFVLFSLALMFSGKICFSVIYVLFVFCNVGIYMFFNFVNEKYISFSKTVTILGYSLLPLCVTPVFGILSRFIKVVPVVLVYIFVAWSTLSASYLFQVELNLDGKLYFIMYPILLYYATFANVVIF